MQIVFEEKWIQELRERYERPGVYAPGLFRVATDTYWKYIRDEIEKWFALLSQESQVSLIKNLRNTKSFLHAYNELAVAGIFLDLGFQVEYEKECNGLTPDWLIISKDKTTSFLVEVFSRVSSKEEESRERQTSELTRRLELIPVGISLLVRYQDLSHLVELNSQLTKRVANLVSKWLTEKTRTLRETVEFNGLVFEVIGYNKKSHVLVAGPTSGAFVVNNMPVVENIEEKVAKYKNISETLEIPLIVAIVPSFNTAIEVDNLEEILFGNEVFVVRNDGSTYSYIDETGLFRKYNILSAVIGLWRNSKGSGWSRAMFNNPDALFPFPGAVQKLMKQES